MTPPPAWAHAWSVPTPPPVISAVDATPAQDAAVGVLDAKHERKLLDLEISNRSLLAINATLEASKFKLTRELRALREQVMMDRVHLDAFDTNGAMDGALLPSHMPKETEVDTSLAQSLGAQLMNALVALEDEMSQTQKRCCAVLDKLLEEGRQALLVQPRGRQPRSKVIHPSELPGAGSDEEEDADEDEVFDTSCSDAEIEKRAGDAAAVPRAP